jgi:hypothetical protein
MKTTAANATAEMNEFLLNINPPQMHERVIMARYVLLKEVGPVCMRNGANRGITCQEAAIPGGKRKCLFYGLNCSTFYTLCQIISHFSIQPCCTW